MRDANAGGFDTVVVRPRFVWGAGDTTLLPEMVKMVKSGRFAWIGGGTQLTDITHVDNVIEGLILGAANGRGGEAYFVTDGEPVVFREFVSALLATQGVAAPTGHSHLGGRSASGDVRGAVADSPLPGQPPLTKFVVWISSQECTIDIAKARRELGYHPIKGRQEGLAELAANR